MKTAELILPLPAHFSFKECLWFLDRRLDECLHTLEGNAITKAILVDDMPVLFRIAQQENALHITILKGDYSVATQEAVVAFVREWLDLDRDLSAFYELLGANERFSYMSSDFYGLRSIGIPTLFEALCWAIIGQQINLTFAYKLKRRLVERYGTSITHQGTDHYLFPSPEQLSTATVDDLRHMQFSGMKAQYLIQLATVFAQGAMSKEILLALPDFTARQKALTSLRGIGIWTANYALMKSLKEASAVPFGDAGLHNALIKHQLITDKSDQEGILKVFREFPGWESYLVFYLWRSLSQAS